MLSILTSLKYCHHSALYHTILTFKDHLEEGLGNTVGKGENAGNHHFLLFQHCFLLFQAEKSSFKQFVICRLQSLSIWSVNQNLVYLVKGYTN